MSTFSVKQANRSVPPFNQFAELTKSKVPAGKRILQVKRFRPSAETDPTMYSTLVEYGFIDGDATTH